MRFIITSVLIFFALALFSQDAFIRTYGMAGSFNEGRGVVAFSDTTYILLGNRTSPQGKAAAWLFKINKSGEVVWEKYFDSYDVSSVENLSKYDETSVLIAGTALKDNMYYMLAARVDTSGNVIWENTYGSDLWSKGYCAVSDSLGNVFLSGYVQNTDSTGQDISLFKINGNNGDTILSKKINDGFNDRGVYVDVFSDGSVGLASHSLDGSYKDKYSKLWIFDKSLDTLWTRKIQFEDSTASIRMVNCIAEDAFNRITLGGYIVPDTSDVIRFWYGCINFWGNNVYEHLFNPIFLKNINRVVNDSKGQNHFVGNMINFYGVVKSDIAYWRDSLYIQRIVVFSESYDDFGYDLDFAADSGIAFIGTTSGYGPGITNIFFIKVAPDCKYNNTDHAHYTPANDYESENVLIFPNPSNGYFQIDVPNDDTYKINIYSLHGKLVKSGTYRHGNVFSINELEDGIYIVRALSKNKSFSFKLILQKQK